LKQADLEWADLVFASAMIVQKDSLRRVVDQCKKLGKPVAIGGPFVSTGAEHFPDADHLFLGEAETTLPQFLHDLENGEAKRIYKAAERPALALTPVPDFHLIDLKRYSSMSVQYSRGCPFQCEFCDIIEIYGRVPRTKSNEQLTAELDALLRIGWRGMVFIVDDNFIGNKRNVKQLLPELTEWSERNKNPFYFITEASVNLAQDDELLKMMKSARFRSVFLGIETPVEESLKEAQKGQNTRGDLLESVKKIQNYGMDVMAGFIVGFDNDPEDIFERQINFIRDSAIPLAMVGLLTALPDTQLWRRLEREGRLLTESTGNNTDCSLNFASKMDPAHLIEGYKAILRTIYHPAEYYQRALDCMKSVKERLPVKQRNGLTQDLMALSRVIMTLGIRDRDRGEFWRYMRRVITEHRETFTEGVKLAAMGYHFRKLTDSYCD
ncbi:MAG: B12-binding domain-containing radical SAM protein, partial [Pyrinomonadaceae bacterium]